ncbi:hypothetical protein TNCV_1274481 [Trichonephila clavipes]|nr:hypothetical protein TNCV_1274481 [Trichonephila clavipes]
MTKTELMNGGQRAVLEFKKNAPVQRGEISSVHWKIEVWKSAELYDHQSLVHHQGAFVGTRHVREELAREPFTFSYSRRTPHRKYKAYQFVVRMPLPVSLLSRYK